MTEPKPSSNEAGASKPGAITRPRAWFRRYPVAAFLIALVLGIISGPFEEHLDYGILIEAARFTVVMLAGLLALGHRRKELVWGTLLITPALLGHWLNHWRPGLLPAWSFLVPALLFLGYVVLHLLLYIIRAQRIDSEVLCASVAGYLMLGLLWTSAYVLTDQLVANSFVFTVGPDASHVLKGFTAQYYSFITLTTVGYGDIVPVSGTARMLAMMESTTGTLYMATLVARLVSLYSMNPVSAQAGDSEK